MEWAALHRGDGLNSWGPRPHITGNFLGQCIAGDQLFPAELKSASGQWLQRDLPRSPLDSRETVRGPARPYPQPPFILSLRRSRPTRSSRDVTLGRDRGDQRLGGV